MANATATHSNGVCTITLPAKPHSIVLIPKTSGTAQWINYCTWNDQNILLGEWSAQRQYMDIVSNPYNVINGTTKHGTITKDTFPKITEMTETSLTFTNQVDKNAPIKADDLKVTTTNASDDITVITILAEDHGDHNYLDFQMTIIVTDN